jgi:hypothetical protein
VTETTESLLPGARATKDPTFVIRYEDADCNMGEMRCQAPNAAVALAVFRQTFSRYSNPQILLARTSKDSLASDLENLQRGIEHQEWSSAQPQERTVA